MVGKIDTNLKIFKSTITNEQLRTACLNVGGLNDLVQKIITDLLKSASEEVCRQN